MSPHSFSHLLPLLALAGLTLGHGGTDGSGGGGGCGGGDSHVHEEEAPHSHETWSSGAVCPPSGGPTAADFGREFLETHCLSCHSESLTGRARRGAPAGVDFDTPEAVRHWAEAIDAHSAAGPNAVNTSMPPASRHQPTQEEREKLGLWLACGAP